MMWNIFSCAYLPSVYCLWWGVCKATSPFLINVFPYCQALRVLCIFWITLLYQICLWQILFPMLTWLLKRNFFFYEDKYITGHFMCYLCTKVVLKCHSWAIIYLHFYVFLQFGAHWIKKKDDNVTSSFQILGSTSLRLFRFEDPIISSIFTQRT